MAAYSTSGARFQDGALEVTFERDDGAAHGNTTD
jgi:hypothetical protein